MSTTTPAFEKSIRYDRETRDYACYLNDEVVGFACTHHQAEIALDALVCELLAERAAPLASEPGSSGVSWNSVPSQYAHASCTGCGAPPTHPDDLCFCGAAQPRIAADPDETALIADIRARLDRRTTDRCDCGADAMVLIRENGTFSYACGVCFLRDFINNRERTSAWEAEAVAAPDAEPPVDDGPADTWGTFYTASCPYCEGAHHVQQCPQMWAQLMADPQPWEVEPPVGPPVEQAVAC